MRLFTCACLLVFTSWLALAQDTRGNISGTVTDAQRAVIAGATVVVTNTGTGTSVRLTTNANGYYKFSNLDAGKYKLDFDAASGYHFTKQNQGSSDAADSDVNSAGQTAEITLGANQHDLTVDAGVYRKASVG
ncbi:MAG TPA: SdrD B-like domain-containing protein, partial [Bryobacteraceae bacterium]|nr:SdrD B-like domain-containing protein [Bryobacteraceae bacterium]